VIELDNFYFDEYENLNLDSESLRQRRAYDAAAKQIIAHKDVLANILKYAVREFKDCSLDEIMSCLSGEPEIGADYIDDYDLPPKMDVAGSESASLREGTRSFDIKFKVKLPKDNKESDLIINIESQNDYNPGYTLEKRGIYYLSRLISGQYNVEFTKSNFDNLKKCYSIWICVNPPDNIANTITEYRFKPENIVGKVPDLPEKYDLMSLVMVNLGVKDENYVGLIKMLDQLLIGMQTNPKKASGILKDEYKINPLTIKEAESDMCNLSQGVYDRGKAEGWAKGKNEGLAEGIGIGRTEGLLKGKEEGKVEAQIDILKRLLGDSVTLDKALEIVDIDVETYKKYLNKED
jgi:hypothetical protein